MFKSILIILSLFFSTLSFSQYSDTISAPEKEKSIKNSIGIDVSPMVSVLTGKSSLAQHLSIQYKHFYNKFNLRAGASYKFDRRGSVFGSSNTVINIQDSLLTFERFFYSDQAAYGSVGFEYVKRKNNFSWLIGGDIIAGIYKFKHLRKESARVYEIDSLGNLTNQSAIYPLPVIKTTTTDSYYFVTGLGFALSMGFDISRNLSLTAQINPTIIYKHGLNQTIRELDGSLGNSGNETKGPLDYGFINLNLNQINLFLNFKF